MFEIEKVPDAFVPDTILSAVLAISAAPAAIDALPPAVTLSAEIEPPLETTTLHRTKPAYRYA
ncbi:hypothetical protein [Burkholderia sp. WSM2232]|uniref:hypothetical protein n=1 Tax=Burkholderia sp. WSM2232 TaxID=944436 RepID=UPI0003F55149|nr:hypothetical protein [Burkholderia sp. WSM2232]